MFPLISPDVLTDLRGLSLGGCAVAIGLGLVLWLWGWWGHRFWIVLLTTLGAGLAGLAWGKWLGLPAPVAALLLALAAGMLALSLARIAAFLAAGLLAWMLVRQFAPAWDLPLVSFVAGGLAGLVLFRFWMMAVTSLAGAMLASYGGLLLAEQLGKIDAALWVESRQQMLHAALAGGMLAGVIVQSLLDRWLWRRQLRAQAAEYEPIPEPAPAPAPPPRRRTWWQLFSTEADFRRAA